MQRSSICKKVLVFLLMGMLFCSGCQKEEFLPEAENDFTFTVIGEE